ncbi:MAG: hypothetical protein JW940_18300 [Polyangiaceae bacterium]|nr:hypothetical protein [Polyangiaceae bacterium]
MSGTRDDPGDRGCFLVLVAGRHEQAGLLACHSSPAIQVVEQAEIGPTTHELVGAKRDRLRLAVQIERTATSIWLRRCYRGP